MPIIEVHLRVGRTVEQKLKLHEKICNAAVEAIECRAEQVRVLITEHAGEDGFSIAGKVLPYPNPNTGEGVK